MLQALYLANLSEKATRDHRTVCLIEFFQQFRQSDRSDISASDLNVCLCVILCYHKMLAYDKKKLYAY